MYHQIQISTTRIIGGGSILVRGGSILVKVRGGDGSNLVNTHGSILVNVDGSILVKGWFDSGHPYCLQL
jgi:hypothetical protein